MGVRMKYLNAVLLLLITSPSWALNRISSVVFNTGEPMPFYMAGALGTLIQMPCDILEATPGTTASLTVKKSEKKASHLWLWLAKQDAKGTNLIVTCANDGPFVLSINPSHETHQDVLTIISSYGTPELQGIPLTEVDSSRKRDSQGGEKK